MPIRWKESPTRLIMTIAANLVAVALCAIPDAHWAARIGAILLAALATRGYVPASAAQRVLDQAAQPKMGAR